MRVCVAILVVASLLAAAAAADIVPVDDANWFFTPHNWLQYTDASSGVTYAQTTNNGAYFKVGFTGSTAVGLVLEQSGAPDSDYMVLRWSVDGLAEQEARLPLKSAARSSVHRKHHSRHAQLSIPTQAVLALGQGLAANVSHSVYVVVRASSQSQDRWTGPACRVRVAGLQLDDGAQTLPVALQPRRLLVFWDSIGEGVQTVKGGSGDLDADDATITWAFSLAAGLRAELSVVAYGGQGYTVTGGGGSVPIVDLQDPSKSAWDHYDLKHSRLTNGKLVPEPDFIFNGHATNDGLHGVPAVNVTTHASAWLHQIRAAAPSAHVLLTVPFGGYMRDALAAAYAQYQQDVQAEPRQHGARDWRTHLLDLGAEAAQGIAQADLGKATAVANDGLHPFGTRSAQLGAMLAVEAVQLMMAVGTH